MSLIWNSKLVGMHSNDNFNKLLQVIIAALVLEPRRLICVILCRRDHVQSLSSSDIMMHGGTGCILAEHVLPELAYKLGRAAKYGA